MSDNIELAIRERRRRALEVLANFAFLEIDGVKVLPTELSDGPQKRVAVLEALRRWPPYAVNGNLLLPDPYDSTISKRMWEVLILETKATVVKREYRRLLMEGIDVNADDVVD